MRCFKPKIAFFLSALLGVACPKAQPLLTPQPLPSDAPWLLFLKQKGLAPALAPGWEKAFLAYELQAGCPLTYEATLKTETRNTDQQPTSLPDQQDGLAIFQIEPNKEGALFSSAKSSLPFESNPGIWLDHFWVADVKVSLAVSAQQLQSQSAPRAPWVDLINAPGAALFFPSLPGESTQLGQRWTANQETNSNPQPDSSQWMPWKKQAPTNYQIEALYSLNGERLAVITAQWSKEGSWSQNPEAPFYQATESGLATYLWLADRGWPLLSEVFVTVNLRTTALDTPEQFYSYTLLGRSILTESCAGLSLPTYR
jgi:hypothetical protein